MIRDKEEVIASFNNESSIFDHCSRRRRGAFLKRSTDELASSDLKCLHQNILGFCRISCLPMHQGEVGTEHQRPLFGKEKATVT
jgi:hypothetical protein